MVPRAGPPDVDDDESKPSCRDFGVPQHSLHVLTILNITALCQSVPTRQPPRFDNRSRRTWRTQYSIIYAPSTPRCGGASGRRSSLKIMQQIAVAIIRPDRPIAFPPAVRLYLYATVGAAANAQLAKSVYYLFITYPLPSVGTYNMF